jgi:Fic family protein
MLTPGPRGRKPRRVLYESVDDALHELARIGGLPSPIEAEDIWGDIWFVEAHNSTAIEGNTLVLKEVKLLLAEGRAVGNKQLADYLDVQGYGRAAQWVYSQALEPRWDAASGPLLTLAEVREVHWQILDARWKVAPHEDATPEETPGNFRRHNIHPFPAGMVPPGWTDISPRMSDWLARVCAGPPAGRPVLEEVADWFAAFERIHPFLDGNGRSGRLLTNLVLIRLGYPPAIVYKRQRTIYLAALRKADAGAPGALGEFLARAVLDTLNRFIVPALAGPHRLVPIAALASETVSHIALRDAAKRGRLKAQRNESGQWLSTRHWVEEYQASRYVRRVSGVQSS